MSIAPDCYGNIGECRICFDSDSTRENPLMNPCLCNGTSKYVHKKCIQHWREVNNNTIYFWKCRECGYNYNLVKAFPKETFIISETNITELRQTRIFVTSYFISFFLSFFFKSF